MIRHDLFTYTLGTLRGGLAAEELSEHLHAAVQACSETGKQATITLTLTIKPNGSTGQMHLVDKIAGKLPQLDKGSTILFATPEGNLQREDPRQGSFDLRTVADDRPKQFKSA